MIEGNIMIDLKLSGIEQKNMRGMYLSYYVYVVTFLILSLKSFRIKIILTQTLSDASGISTHSWLTPWVSKDKLSLYKIVVSFLEPS